MYPLNMSLAAPSIGFALANDAEEHKDLSDAGYLPAFVAPKKQKAAAPDVADSQTLA